MGAIAKLGWRWWCVPREWVIATLPTLSEWFLRCQRSPQGNEAVVLPENHHQWRFLRTPSERWRGVFRWDKNVFACLQKDPKIFPLCVETLVEFAKLCAAFTGKKCPHKKWWITASFASLAIRDLRFHYPKGYTFPTPNHLHRLTSKNTGWQIATVPRRSYQAVKNIFLEDTKIICFH